MASSTIPTSTTPLTSSPPTSLINYVTDVEGNYEYFLKYILHSRLTFTDPTQTRLQLAEGDYFVYGGDAYDKGNGDIRVSRLLVQLKKDYPDRVFLLIGNRDLNKIKLSSELHDSDLARSPDEVTGPYWVPEKYRKTFSAYVEDLKSTIDLDYDSLSLEARRVVKLKWLLSHTMGCPNSFEFRRQELALLAGQEGNGDISDEEVANHFFQSVSTPTGFVRQYLDNAQLVVCIGNNVFVHGALKLESLGFIPSKEMKDDIQDDVPGTDYKGTIGVREWADKLNSWSRMKLEEWKAAPQWNEARSVRGGSQLMGYAYGPAAHERTVMITDYLSQGNPTIPDHLEELSQHLTNDNISRVVVGHKPFGDSPTVMSTPSLELVTADISYSDMTAPDNRGEAFEVVEVENELPLDSSTSRSRVKLAGSLHTREKYRFALPYRNGKGVVDLESGDPFVGRHLPTSPPWWVKAPITTVSLYAAEEEYLVSRGQGHKVSYAKVRKGTLETGLASENWDWSQL